MWRVEIQLYSLPMLGSYGLLLGNLLVAIFVEHLIILKRCGISIQLLSHYLLNQLSCLLFEMASRDFSFEYHLPILKYLQIRYLWNSIDTDV